MRGEDAPTPAEVAALLAEVRAALADIRDQLQRIEVRLALLPMPRNAGLPTARDA